MQTRSCCIPTLPRCKGAPAGLGTTKAALAAKKASGIKLGNPRNITRAGELGRSVQAATADQFVANLMPVVRAIQNSGATTLEAITLALNQRGIWE